jgi:NAD(P)H-flavin reductase
MKHYLSCAVVFVTPVTQAIFRLDCRWEGTAPKAGQFFMLKPERGSTFLPRPISAAFWNSADSTLGFLILRKGRGTEELAALRFGEILYISGPLGNCWEDFLPGGGGAESSASAAEKNGAEKPIALVGGGIGVAPLLSLPARIRRRFDFFAGFKTHFTNAEERTNLIGAAESLAEKTIVAIEEAPPQHESAANGVKIGRIPDFLNPPDYAAVFACGPEAMLRAVAEKCAAANVPCYTSLERRMACGAGACLGCTVLTKDGPRRCCADGPIFPAEAVL